MERCKYERISGLLVKRIYAKYNVVVIKARR